MAALFALCLSRVAEGQMAPDAPVLDFKLPMFDDETGYKVWELSGTEGRYVSPERIDVRGMRLRILSGEADLEAHSMIESPRATMLIRENRAMGDSSLTVTGGNFGLRGGDWSWEGETRTLIVRRNAKVVFKEKLTDILR